MLDKKEIVMTNEGLIKKIILLYTKARKSVFPHDRIARGESHSISSQTEDLLAYFLIQKLPSDTRIFINQTITSGSKEERIRVKPDIVIVRNKQIRAILDLKMDLGYMRNEFPVFWDERDALIPRMRNKEFSMFQKDGNKTIPLLLEFAERTKLFFVVVSDQNINSRKLSEVKNRQGKKQYSETFILTKEVHPNSYKYSANDLIYKIKINADGIQSLIDELKSIV